MKTVSPSAEFAAAEIEELSKLDPREAFPYYFEGEDGQDELSIGAMDAEAAAALIIKSPKLLSDALENTAAMNRAQFDSDEITMN